MKTADNGQERYKCQKKLRDPCDLRVIMFVLMHHRNPNCPSEEPNSLKMHWSLARESHELTVGGMAEEKVELVYSDEPLTRATLFPPPPAPLFWSAHLFYF